MGYFEDFREGFATPDPIERENIREAGFDPDCPEDRQAVRVENACNHEWHSRVSELGADFVSCNRCGADSRRNNEGETR